MERSRSGIGRSSSGRLRSAVAARRHARGSRAALAHSQSTPRLPPASSASSTSSYAAYGYTEQPAYEDDSSPQSGLLQSELFQPYQSVLASDAGQIPLSQPGASAFHVRHSHSQPQQEQQQQFAQFQPAIAYTLSPTGPALYDIMPQYHPTRQSAGLEAMPSEITVPQYFPPADPAVSGIPAENQPFLAAVSSGHALPFNNNYPGSFRRSNDELALPFSAAMPAANLSSEEMAERPELPPETVPEVANLEEAYMQFQQALRSTIDHIQSGRLVDASRSVLKISDWLVTNARELGLLRDDQIPYATRLGLWNDFNICWLALCQKQKDMTRRILRTDSHRLPSSSVLDAAALENLAKELIELCDRLEDHGLVDYQMGVWEEEILSVLGQCLDITEDLSQSGNQRASAVAVMTTAATTLP